jgi:hypothetical protein
MASDAAELSLTLFARGAGEARFGGHACAGGGTTAAFRIDAASGILTKLKTWSRGGTHDNTNSHVQCEHKVNAKDWTPWKWKEPHLIVVWPEYWHSDKCSTLEAQTWSNGELQLESQSVAFSVVHCAEKNSGGKTLIQELIASLEILERVLRLVLEGTVFRRKRLCMSKVLHACIGLNMLEITWSCLIDAWGISHATQSQSLNRQRPNRLTES